MFSGLMPLHTPRHIGLAICSFNLATPTAMSCQDAQRKWNEAVLRPFFLQIGEANSNLQSLAKNCPCLLADVAWRWSLPEPGVALEALRSEVTVEELHDELGQHSALAGSTAECHKTFRCGLSPILFDTSRIDL